MVVCAFGGMVSELAGTISTLFLVFLFEANMYVILFKKLGTMLVWCLEFFHNFMYFHIQYGTEINQSSYPHYICEIFPSL